MVLVADTDNDVAEVHDDHVGDHGRETHLGLANAVVAAGCAIRDPVGERARSREADEGAD